MNVEATWCIEDSMCSESTAVCASQDPHKPRQQCSLEPRMIGASTEASGSSGSSLDCNMNRVTQLSSNLSLVRCLQEDTDLSEQQIAACVEDGFVAAGMGGIEAGTGAGAGAAISSSETLTPLSASSLSNPISQLHHSPLSPEQQHIQHYHHHQHPHHPHHHHQQQHPHQQTTTQTGSREEQGCSKGIFDHVTQGGRCEYSEEARAHTKLDQSMNMVQFVEQCYQANNRYAANGQR
jgi:hypothetical protein